MYATIHINNTQYILPVDEVVGILKKVETAKKYEEVWHRTEDGGTTYHVFDIDANERQYSNKITLICDDLYRMAKLAGEPNKNQ